MAELDRFEARFAAAYRRYLDEVPTEVDAAAVARTAALQPRVRRLALPLALRPIPALAWLVLLGLVVMSLVGAALFVGSQRPAVVGFTCPAGTNPDERGPVDQARPTDSGPAMAFDRHAGRLVALAATSVEGVLETWTFDVCTNTWTRMHPDREPPFMNQLVYDVDSDLMIASDGTRMWAYDLDTDTWTEKGPFAPFVHSHLANLWFYDPVSGRVVAVGDDSSGDSHGLELWGYQVETDTWTPIPEANRPVIGPNTEFAPFVAYDTSVDRLVAYAWTSEAAAGTWLLDLRTGTWSGTGAVTPQFSGGFWGTSWPGFAYDEAAERTVMLGRGPSSAYDATADRWEVLYPSACGTHPLCRYYPTLVYDSVNARLVVSGGWVPTTDGVGINPDDVLAFDTQTGEWTVLLAPSDEQPAP